MDLFKRARAVVSVYGKGKKTLTTFTGTTALLAPLSCQGKLGWRDASPTNKLCFLAKCSLKDLSWPLADSNTFLQVSTGSSFAQRQKPEESEMLPWEWIPQER